MTSSDLTDQQTDGAHAERLIDSRVTLGNLTMSRLSAADIVVAKEEERERQTSRVYVDGEELLRQLKAENRLHTDIVDHELGYSNRTLRFFINHVPPGEEGQQWKTLGHRHTVEAVIYWLQGHGHSIIDGKRFDWGPGDIVSVPTFAWHRHVNDSDGLAQYVAATTTPLSTALGQVIFEDERFPEYWTFAQQGEDALRTLIPGGASTDLGGELPANSTAARLYAEQVAFAAKEEHLRRDSKVLVKPSDLRFEPTAMGHLAYAVDRRVGFYVKVISTLVAQIPPCKHSGAHRHHYDEVDFILSGKGRCIVNDQTYAVKKGDVVAVPVFAWHQYFNTGDAPMRILAHNTRPAMENLGLMLTQQGEWADY